MKERHNPVPDLLIVIFSCAALNYVQREKQISQPALLNKIKETYRYYQETVQYDPNDPINVTDAYFFNLQTGVNHGHAVSNIIKIISPDVTINEKNMYKPSFSPPPSFNRGRYKQGL